MHDKVDMDEIYAMFEHKPSMAELREEYYAAEVKKAEARKARDKEAFDFYVNLARELRKLIK